MQASRTDILILAGFYALNVFIITAFCRSDPSTKFLLFLK